MVLLQNSDYKNRDKLFKVIESEFKKTRNNTSRPAWERYSVAYGMATYQLGDNVEDVFKRADDSMYQKKMEIKGMA